MEKVNNKQHQFFSLFSEDFFGKSARTSPKGRLANEVSGRSGAPEKIEEKSVEKAALRLEIFSIAEVNT